MSSDLEFSGNDPQITLLTQTLLLLHAVIDSKKQNAKIKETNLFLIIIQHIFFSVNEPNVNFIITVLSNLRQPKSILRMITSTTVRSIHAYPPKEQKRLYCHSMTRNDCSGIFSTGGL